LTRLLRDSFGGRSSTTVVVCAAGAEEHDEETVRSLEFGKRLGGVRSKAVAAGSEGGQVSGEAARARVDGSVGPQSLSLHRKLTPFPPSFFHPLAQSARRSKAEIEVALELKREELAALDGGGVDATVSQVAAERFMKELSRLEGLRQNLNAAEERNYEAGGKKASGEVLALREQVKGLSEDTERKKGAVDRLSARRFWREPSPAHLKKAAEVREIEAMLVRFAV